MYSAAQIVSLACQIAKVPGMKSQAGQQLNVILADLAQLNDLEANRGFFQFNFNPGLISAPNNNVVAGGGPYLLPLDYLRAEKDDVFWTFNGVPYPMVNIELQQFDMTVQIAGNQSFPYYYTTDVSPLSLNPPAQPQLWVYPPPSGAYQVTVRYKKQVADIATPETSAVIPWFPNQNYLITRLAGELMKIADDTRSDKYLGDTPGGAEYILKAYLKMEGDRLSRAKVVTLDRRYFRPNFSALPNTKQLGW